jgi:undecaprenyl diphosphate synthase
MTEYELPSDIDVTKMPQHIAIIMDGNGRWAAKRGVPRLMGHRAGIKTVREIVRACGAIGIDYLTLYTFSSENWKRPAEEVNGLMNLLKNTLSKEINKLDKNNVKLSTIGRMHELPPAVQDGFKKGQKKLANNTGLHLILALNYGGRTEIVDAIREIAQQVLDKQLKPNQIEEHTVEEHLYTRGVPHPDLVIRTGGEMRISNYLLWQIAYSELYITPILWPDFTSDDLYDAIRSFQGRERRFGGLKNI